MHNPAPPDFDLEGLGICINKHFSGWVGGFPLEKKKLAEVEMPY